MNALHAPTGISVLAVYVDDYEGALAFYQNVLGLVKSSDMGQTGCLLSFGEGNPPLYLEGGNAPASSGPRTARVSFAFEVPSTGALFERLKEAGAELVHPAPSSMGGDLYWFQFKDPAGNVLEATGKA